MNPTVLPVSFPVVMCTPGWKPKNAWQVLAFAALYVTILGHPADIATEWAREWL